jgi:hypothetical protein
MNTIITSNCINLRCQPRQNTALTFVILMNNTSTIARKSWFRDQLISKVVEIKLHPNNINSEDGYSVSSSSKPLIHSLKERKKFPPRTNRLLPPK